MEVDQSNLKQYCSSLESELQSNWGFIATCARSRVFILNLRHDGLRLFVQNLLTTTHCIIGATIISIGLYAVFWGKGTEEIEEDVIVGSLESATTDNVPLCKAMEMKLLKRMFKRQIRTVKKSSSYHRTAEYT